MEPSAPCQRHPEAAAGWKCDGCEASLCPECVATKRAQTAEFFACLLCGGRATHLLVHRRAMPFSRRLLDAWRYPFETHNLLILIALSPVLALFRWLVDQGFLAVKVVPGLMGLGVFWGALFSVIRSTARGEKLLELPDYTDFFADFVAPALRGVAATSLLWLPGLLYVLYLREKLENFRAGVDEVLSNPVTYNNHVPQQLPEVDGALWADPFLWMIVAAGVFYLPMVLMAAAGGASGLDIYNPVRVIGRIRHLGRDYVLAVGALLALAVPYALTHLMGLGLRSLDIFLVSRVLREFLTTLAPFTMAHVLGLLLYTRGDSLGWGLARDYLVPALGGVQPRTQPEALRAPQAPGVELAPEPPPAVAPELASLAQAVAARDVPQALALYPALQAVPEVRKAVEPAHHLFVGQAAAAQGDYTLAVQALEAAADVAPDAPTAPRALVILARVFGERLQEPERAEGIYRYIVHRYPDTDASRFAEQRIPSPVPES